MPDALEIKFPRKNGLWTDDGTKNKSGSEPCINCGSSEFYSTVSIEHCPKCGLLCDYWGNGPNKIYLDAVKRKHWEEERERQRREIEEEEERERERLAEDSEYYGY